ncbi:MFS transporter [Bordetella petrii]|uniref:Membrane protein n=1 Tax=Bordetella petrii (strain ATCC BAA-461 / DSM 12804 / CCUG 43448 / CIP 107267 / Se-1111R) TaxID=340100 RepID=A9IIW0_BORPD|nr:MFS transporter [Bordetella petrii]CAP42180.1 putative membrane protein [Bordetella petrii]
MTEQTLAARLAPAASRRQRQALAALCLAVLVAQVDTAAVNLATRAVGLHFHAGVQALQWVIDSYNLAYAALLLTGGLLADLWGRRRVFLLGAGLFCAASLGCALAPSVAALVAARVGAGVGAALLIPASLALIRVGWPDPAARARVLGIWAACNGLALAVGPTLGGILMQHYGWPGIFLAAIPLGVAAMALAWRAIPESSDPRGRRWDAGAQAMAAVALAALALAAIESHTTPWLAVVAATVAAMAVAGFIRIERRAEAAALVPLSLFRSARFCGALAATSAMTFGMYGALFLLPLAWQDSGRFDAVQAGLALMPMALVFVLISPWSGLLCGRLGRRAMTAGGVAIIGAGLWLIALGAASAALAPALAGLAATGLGMGLATGPLMDTAVSSVPAARAGTASALVNVARMVGATLGVALSGSLYTLAGSGMPGLRLAMLAGGAVQLAAAAAAWRMRRGNPG